MPLTVSKVHRTRDESRFVNFSLISCIIFMFKAELEVLPVSQPELTCGQQPCDTFPFHCSRNSFHTTVGGREREGIWYKHYLSSQSFPEAGKWLPSKF